jgi:cell wall-associated NlpC family hydrolase
MSRRYALAPVVCLVVLGLIMISSAPVMARTKPGGSKPSELARQHSDNLAGKKHEGVHGTRGKKHDMKDASTGKMKKGASLKRAAHGRAEASSARERTKVGSKRAHAASHKKKTHVALASRHKTSVRARHKPSSRTVDVQAQAPTGVQSDLWLAKDNPGLYRSVVEQDQTEVLDKLTRNIVLSAYRYLGSPYRYGGTTPSGFDCSGFVQRVFGENGIELSRSSREQIREGVPVDMPGLKPGDLVFFKMRNGGRTDVDHVGLYVGGGLFIHASSYGTGEISIDTLGSSVYSRRMVGARRVLEHPSDQSVLIE